MDQKNSHLNTQTEYQLLTVGQTARRLNVSRSSVYALIERGELPAIRLGRVIRFRPEDVDEVYQRQLAARAAKSQPQRKRSNK